MENKFTQWSNPIQTKWLTKELIRFNLSVSIFFIVLGLVLWIINLETGSGIFYFISLVLAALFVFLLQHPIRCKIRKKFLFRLTDKGIEMQQWNLFTTGITPVKSPTGESITFVPYDAINDIYLQEGWLNAQLGMKAFSAKTNLGTILHGTGDRNADQVGFAGTRIKIPGMIPAEADALYREVLIRVNIKTIEQNQKPTIFQTSQNKQEIHYRSPYTPFTWVIIVFVTLLLLIIFYYRITFNIW